MELKDSKTLQALLEALAREAQTNRLYLYFAAKADVEGFAEVSAVFRSSAEGETGHAHGCIEYLEASGIYPLGEGPIGDTRANLVAAIAAEEMESSIFYPERAIVARKEGFPEIADWFEVLGKAERAHATRFKRTLDSIGGAR